jgi:hypothetical protein
MNPIGEQKWIPGQFGKEAIAGAYRRPKWVLYYSTQADPGGAQAQARLRLGSGMLTLSSG